MTTRYVPARVDLIDHTNDTVPGDDNRIIQGSTYYTEFDANISLAAWDGANKGLKFTFRDENFNLLNPAVTPAMAWITSASGTFSMSIGSTKMEDVKQLSGWYEVKVYDTATLVNGDPYELVVAYGKWKMRRLITE